MHLAHVVCVGRHMDLCNVLGTWVSVCVRERICLAYNLYTSFLLLAINTYLKRPAGYVTFWCFFKNKILIFVLFCKGWNQCLFHKRKRINEDQYIYIYIYSILQITYISALKWGPRTIEIKPPHTVYEPHWRSTPPQAVWLYRFRLIQTIWFLWSGGVHRYVSEASLCSLDSYRTIMTL